MFLEAGRREEASGLLALPALRTGLHWPVGRKIRPQCLRRSPLGYRADLGRLQGGPESTQQRMPHTAHSDILVFIQLDSEIPSGRDHVLHILCPQHQGPCPHRHPHEHVTGKEEEVVSNE